LFSTRTADRAAFGFTVGAGVRDPAVVFGVVGVGVGLAVDRVALGEAEGVWLSDDVCVDWAAWRPLGWFSATIAT
jgi:hypothetical protein